LTATSILAHLLATRNTEETDGGALLLPIRRHGDFWARVDDGGHVARAEISPDRGGDAGLQVGRAGNSWGHLEEEHDVLVGVVCAALADAQGVLDRRGEVLQQDVVDLGAAEAHARGFEDAVAAAEHHHAAGGGVEAHEVAVVPDAREALEVAAGVLGIVVADGEECGVGAGRGGELGVGLGPEADGLGGEGFSADEVAGLAGGDGMAVVVDGADGHAEAIDLDLALVDGGDGGGGAEEGDDVGSAGDAAEVDGGGEGVVDVAEGAGREGGAGGVDGPEGAEVQAGFQGLGAVLLEDADVLGRGAELGDLELLDQLGHGKVAVRFKGAAVVEDDGGAGCEARDEPVPHHP
jgi:hypothetical protein